MRLLIAVAAAGSVLGSALVQAMYLPSPDAPGSVIVDVQKKKRKGRWQGQGQGKGGAKMKMKKGKGSPKGPKCFNACIAKGKSAKACNSRCN